METVKVDSEELENYPIENFIGKFVYNHWFTFEFLYKNINLTLIKK